MSRFLYWAAPAFGLLALALVQTGVVGSALWMSLMGDEFQRYERVTIVGSFPGYRPRWLIERGNGEVMKIPPPASIDFDVGRSLCVGLTRGRLGNLKARLAATEACAST